jgi:AraC family transcriptional regulator
MRRYNAGRRIVLNATRDFERGDEPQGRNDGQALMSGQPVPVSIGSTDFSTWNAQCALVTRVSLPAWKSVPAHMHEQPTFAVVLSGGFDLEFTRSRVHPLPIPCGAGTIVTQPQGEWHINHVGADGASGVVVQPDVSEGKLPVRCARVLDSVLHFQDPTISLAAWRLAREVAFPDDLTALAVDGLVLEMLVQAARLDATKGLGQIGAPRWLRTAMEFLHENFLETVRMEAVAAVAGVHPAHLGATFRRAYGLTISAYVRRLRVEWAAEQLRATEATIAEIAVAAGFADQAHLTRWFRRATGFTPASYRRIGR